MLLRAATFLLELFVAALPSFMHQRWQRLRLRQAETDASARFPTSQPHNPSCTTLRSLVGKCTINPLQQARFTSSLPVCPSLCLCLPAVVHRTMSSRVPACTYLIATTFVQRVELG
jgi:hypothetical protein